MKTRKTCLQIVCCCLALALVLSACDVFFPTPAQTDLDAIRTYAAETVVSQLTLSAGETAIAQLTQIAGGTPIAAAPSATSTGVIIPASATPLPPTPTFTLPPTWTPIPPTWTPPPPPPPPPTPVPLPCDWAQFVKDVSIPDGTSFPPGASFTKTWRIRNIGACTWGNGYALLYYGGDRMQSYNAVPLPALVRPGETVDLSVALIAPSAPGRYRSYWMLGNQFGQAFGIGSAANKPFWADIRVIASSSAYAYDFSANMCTAAWRSSASSLPCPGDRGSDAGSVIMLNQPELENGRHENEPAIWMRPETTNDGWITGVYPAYRVRAGDRFLADIGCLLDSQGCDVTFHLGYQIPGQPVQPIGSWREVYDGKMTRLDIDLSSLAGQNVQFILSVTTNDRPARANAVWFVPSIRN
jgi:hypothetical protein